MSYSIGSVTEAVLQLVPELPTTLSGTNLNAFATQARILASNFTQANLTYPVDETHFGPIVNIAAGLALAARAGVGVDASSVSLGELTIEKGANNPDSVIAQTWLDLGKYNLKQVGRRVAFGKSW